MWDNLSLSKNNTYPIGSSSGSMEKIPNRIYKKERREQDRENMWLNIKVFFLLFLLKELIPWSKNEIVLWM